MRTLFGLMVFPNTQRRNQTQTRIQSEVTTRGLVVGTYDFGAPHGVVSGTVAKTIDGQPGLLVAYAGPDEAIQQAEVDLYEYFRGQWAEGCYFGSQWTS